jgi:hypothetical protein
LKYRVVEDLVASNNSARHLSREDRVHSRVEHRLRGVCTFRANGLACDVRRLFGPCIGLVVATCAHLLPACTRVLNRFTRQVAIRAAGKCMVEVVVDLLVVPSTDFASVILAFELVLQRVPRVIEVPIVVRKFAVSAARPWQAVEDALHGRGLKVVVVRCFDLSALGQVPSLTKRRLCRCWRRPSFSANGFTDRSL